MDLKVFVAAHKAYPFPEDPVYQPIQVGRATAQQALPFIGDNTGDNISSLNNTYCELTALYWSWKNTAHEAYGLVHYRRYFAGARKAPAAGAQLASFLVGHDVVVATRRHYVIQTVQQQYANSHHGSDLDAVRETLVGLDPSSVRAFDKVMSGRSISLYNMFLMRRPLLDEYCAWLFPILEASGQHIPLETYGPQQRRVLGYLGERLFNVWLAANPGLSIHRQPVFESEPRSTILAGTHMVARMVGVGRNV